MRLEKWILFSALTVFGAPWIGNGLALAAKPTAESILKQVDGIRNPSESYLMKVQVKDLSGSDSSSGDDPSVYEVSIQSNRKTLIKTLAPPRDRGRNLLMLDQDMWAYIPNLKRAVRVSLSQKLTGQAANGDISRMRWSGDYTAKIQDETPTQWTLFLTAQKKDLTYDQLRVWVQKKTYRPLRAEFLTAAGKTLKTATYGAYKPIVGKTRPTQMIIQDAVREKDRSEIDILDMQVRNIPSSLFNQNNLGD
jgi:outer membrane lipoprotein-sorting protein